MSITLEKAELQLGIEHIKSLLKIKPCDSSIIIRHTYKVRSSAYFEYDLFKFAYPDKDDNPIKRLECSYFLEQLLTWFGHSYPTQQKHEKITLWEQITGYRLYDGNTLDSFLSRDRFFCIVGFFIYGNIYGNIAHRFDIGKNAKLKMITTLGEECFYLITDYLDEKYGDAYNRGKPLPKPKQNKSSIIGEVLAKFINFLDTNPQITSETKIQERSYSVYGFLLDFDSVHKATYSWAVDYLILELLAALNYHASVLNALKANVRIPDNAETISESKFYQLFGCCVLLATQAGNQEIKLSTLKRLGKVSFLKLVEHLQNK